MVKDLLSLICFLMRIYLFVSTFGLSFSFRFLLKAWLSSYISGFGKITHCPLLSWWTRRSVSCFCIHAWHSIIQKDWWHVTQVFYASLSKSSCISSLYYTSWSDLKADSTGIPYLPVFYSDSKIPLTSVFFGWLCIILLMSMVALILDL